MMLSYVKTVFVRLFSWAGLKKCGCGSRNNVKRRRQNTQYVDDKENYVICCGECFEEIQAYWSERRQEYYDDCM